MLANIAKFFLALSLFSVLIVATSTFFPFIGGKYYFFRLSVSFALIFFLFSWAFEAKEADVRRWKQKLRSPLVIAVTAFVAAFLLASVFAYDASSAFWSNYERADGGFQMLHYYVFFLLLVFLLDDAKSWRRMFMVSVVAALLMILYGLITAIPVRGFVGPYIGADGKLLGDTFLSRLFSATRFQGSLGNPAYVAPYLLFILFHSLYLWATGEKLSQLKKIGYGVLLAALVVFFILSQTRGAFLGLVAGVFAFGIYFVLFHKRWRARALTALIALIAVGAILFQFRYAPFVQNLPGGRLLAIDLASNSSQNRIWTWTSAWEGFKERPIFGWGPENFSAVFDKYFNPRHYIVGQGTETWFDRAHSIVFDYLSETGLIGFLAYLSMFVVFFLLFIKVAKKHHEAADASRRPIARALVVALPVAYLVQGLFLFDVLATYINLFLFLAFAQFWLSHKFQPAAKPKAA